MYKRLETYVGWTCNQRCTYCVEYENMEKTWHKKVSKYDILKKLLKYKKLGYNHVTYLGGEPFIQPVFLDALKLGKKLGYTILVATNCTTLHIDSQARKFLPYIDELFLSVEAIDVVLQQKISRTQNFVNWEGVFDNIGKYWQGKMLKANIVITKDNLAHLFDMVVFLHRKGVKNIAITYPDINYKYFGKKHILDRMAPRYSECIREIIPIIHFCSENGIYLKLPDFPFCVFPEKNIEEYIRYTDDFDYQTRVKIDNFDNILDRGILDSEEGASSKDIEKSLPRKRMHIQECEKCIYSTLCWGVSRSYEELYGLDEIHSL